MSRYQRNRNSLINRAYSAQRLYSWERDVRRQAAMIARDLAWIAAWTLAMVALCLAG
jgi:hypothetical protein